MTVNNRANNRFSRTERQAMVKRAGTAVAAVAVYCSLNGCAGRLPEWQSDASRQELTDAVGYPAGNGAVASARRMPPWLDIYRERKVVNVSTVDHVVIVTFETLGGRDEVYNYYKDKFAGEENFSSFRDNRDIISFIRDGFGVKITLLDQSRNLWSLEYHRQMI